SGGVGKELQKILTDAPSKEKKEKEALNKKPIDEELAKQLEAKASRPAFDVNIRLLASSATEQETISILQSLEGAFAQFNNPQGNDLRVTRLAGKALEKLIYQFSFRIFDSSRSIYLSTIELASMF